MASYVMYTVLGVQNTDRSAHLSRTECCPVLSSSASGCQVGP